MVWTKIKRAYQLGVLISLALITAGAVASVGLPPDRLSAKEAPATPNRVSRKTILSPGSNPVAD